jgi:hypothetical protein
MLHVLSDCIDRVGKVMNPGFLTGKPGLDLQLQSFFALPEKTKAKMQYSTAIPNTPICQYK